MSNDPGPQGQLSPLKRAISELRKLRTKLNEMERRENEPIAIVGLGIRFPGGAHHESSLWQILAHGVNTATEIPRDRWDLEAYYDSDPDKPGKMNTRHGAFLSGVDQFDAEFFGVSPREAISMDPQHRLLMESSWEALENAAIAPATLLGTQMGIFVGIGNNDYWRMVYGNEEQIDAYSALGNSYSAAAGRLSYFLGVHGPSMAIDTACSSSLVAVHLACRSLRSGECNLALAAGVNLILSPQANINFSKSRMLAPDGRCKTFDARADGYVRGEGCGVVLLKTLSQARTDGSRILAVIRGSAVNQDGRSGGLTAPNGPAQEAVIREALAAAGVAPQEVSYLEAHGTGTSLGDPIEVRAAGAVLCKDRPHALHWRLDIDLHQACDAGRHEGNDSPHEL
jgi:acyl transferase domain-containing protein